MSTVKDWEVLPSSDLADRASWRSLGGNRYGALRVRLLIVCSDGQQSRFGPVIKAYNVAPEDTIELRRRREQVISRTTTISEAIRFTTTSRVCDQLATKVSSELSGKGLGFSGKLSSEILSKSEYEITETTEDVLGATTSHVIQETEEDEHVITLKGGTKPRVAELRRRYWPRRWNVYLHSYEYFELSYRRSWYWWQVRETIKKTDSGVLGWPLVSVVFYEPQSGIDVCYTTSNRAKSRLGWRGTDANRQPENSRSHDWQEAGEPSSCGEDDIGKAPAPPCQINQHRYPLPRSVKQ